MYYGYMYVCIYVCMYVRMYVHMYICMYVLCVDVCMYTDTYILCTRYKACVDWICLAWSGLATSCGYCEQNVYTSSSVEDEKSFEKLSNCYILKEESVQRNYKAYEEKGGGRRNI